MKREEIEEQIRTILTGSYDIQLVGDEKIKELTDLFIELSTDIAKEQRKKCWINFKSSQYHSSDDILNAPLPEIK